jgi:chaperonin GroES
MAKKKSVSRKALPKSSKKASKPKTVSETVSTGMVTIGTTKIQPLGDRVVVRQHQDEFEKTASGIFIPDTVKKEKPEKGTVVAVGEGRRGEDGTLMPLSIKVGDTVVFSKYGFDEIKINGEEYLIIKEDHILAVINEK